MFFLIQGRLGRRAYNLAWFFNIFVVGIFAGKIVLPELMELTKTAAGQPKFAEQHLTSVSVRVSIPICRHRIGLARLCIEYQTPP